MKTIQVELKNDKSKIKRMKKIIMTKLKKKKSVVQIIEQQNQSTNL